MGDAQRERVVRIVGGDFAIQPQRAFQGLVQPGACRVEMTPLAHVGKMKDAVRCVQRRRQFVQPVEPAAHHQQCRTHAISGESGRIGPQRRIDQRRRPTLAGVQLMQRDLTASGGDHRVHGNGPGGPPGCGRLSPAA